MTITTEEFVSNFHSLTGTTIGERQKNLFYLLNQIKQTETTQLNFSQLNPTTPLEEKFKIKILIYFRRTTELVEVLKSENPILIERILRENWFVEQAFQCITGKQLVEHIFPNVSFNVKVKIVNKFSIYLKDLNKADEFFKAINEKYGLYLASKLLSACSLDVIINCIKLNRIKVPPKQLLDIIKKYPQVTETILKLLQNNGVVVRIFYKNIFVYLAHHDHVLFLKLTKKYNFSMRLGKRATHKFIQINKQKIMENPREYHELLHHKQIIKSLSVDFNVYFQNLFPKSLSEMEVWYEYIFKLLKLLPSNQQIINLLTTTFKKVYGTELWNYPKYVNLELLEMLPANEREAKLKPEYKPEHFTEDQWSTYQTTQKSIPHLKKRISLTSDIKARAKIIPCLVETCKINKDKQALLDVCKYMLSQHRNDHISVRLAFLRVLQEDYDLLNLEAEHWSCVNEFVRIFALNKETFYEDDEFLEAYIHFKLENGLPIKEELTKWLHTHNMWLNIPRNALQHEKKCLLLFGDIIPELYEGEKLRKYNLSLLAAIMKWNNKNPKDRISLFRFKSAMNHLEELLVTEEYIYEADSILIHCLCTEFNTEERNKILRLYLKRTNKYADLDVMDKLIKYEPLTVVQNIEDVTRIVLRVDRDRQPNWFFWKHCRNYTHLEIPQNVIKICLDTFEENAPDITGPQFEERRFNIITALSYLMPADAFKNFITPYYPSEMKVNVNSKEEQMLYGLRKVIGYNLKNVIPTSQVLESVLIFCKGDFLKLIRITLYSLSDNVNETSLLPVFKELSNRAVSVRKHAMHLTFRIMDKNQIYAMVQSFMETEKNASIRKFILKGVFNFFIKNSDDYSWELVKSNVTALDVNDQEGIKILMQINKIPRQYMEKYVVFTWDTLSKLPDPEGQVISKKVTLLNSITPDIIKLLSKEFCESIISENLFKDTDHLTDFQFAVQRFTCKYIIFSSSPQEQEERLNVNFIILKNYITNTWIQKETRHTGRKCAANFVKEFCDIFLGGQSQDKDVFMKFMKLWNEFLKPHECFDIFLTMQFISVYMDKLAIKETVLKLTEICDTLTNIYGSVIITTFYEKLKQYNNYFVNSCEEEKMYYFIEQFLQHNTSASSLLVILLLNDHHPSMIETEVRYEKIIKTLQQKSEPTIQLYLSDHFCQ